MNYCLRKIKLAFKERNNELTTTVSDELFKKKSLENDLNELKESFTREMTLTQHENDLLKEHIEYLKNTTKETTGGTSTLEKDRLLHELVDIKKSLEKSELENVHLNDFIEQYLTENEESTSDNELVLLKEQLIKEKRQKDYLQEQVELFVIELENQLPTVNSLKDRNQTLEQELMQITGLLEETERESDIRIKELTTENRRLKEQTENINVLMSQRVDLAHQVQFLLLNLDLKKHQQHLLTPDEITFLRKIIKSRNSQNDSDSQKIISERLVKFHDISVLQKQNMELLTTTRNLAEQLESSDTKSVQKITRNESKEKIAKLQESINGLTSKLA